MGESSRNRVVYYVDNSQEGDLGYQAYTSRQLSLLKQLSPKSEQNMKTELQNSIQQRMREIHTKLKGLSSAFTDPSIFEECSLCLDRFDKLVHQVAVDTQKHLDDKKEAAKEMRVKTAHLRDARKEIQSMRIGKKKSESEKDHVIVVFKNQVSELKRKLETAKESSDHFHTEKIKEENLQLLKQADRDRSLINALTHDKALMVPAAEHKALKAELTECQKALTQQTRKERKYDHLAEECHQKDLKLSEQTTEICHLQSIIDRQNEEIISCMVSEDLMKEDDRISSRTSETCESIQDCQMEDIDIQRCKKRRRNKKKGKKWHPQSNIGTIEEEPEESTEKEISGEITPSGWGIGMSSVGSLGVAMLCMLCLVGILDWSW